MSKKDDTKEDSVNSNHSKNVKGCVNYMMHYASRPAMAERRITSYNQSTDDIEWFYDDHTTDERIVVNESWKELLKKIFIHIPEKNFRMVRYYGFHNNKCQELLDTLHTILGEKRDKDYSRERRNQNKKKKTQQAQIQNFYSRYL